MPYQKSEAEEEKPGCRETKKKKKKWTEHNGNENLTKI